MEGKSEGEVQYWSFKRIVTFQVVFAATIFIQLINLRLLDLKPACIFQHYSSVNELPQSTYLKFIVITGFLSI